MFPAWWHSITFPKQIQSREFFYFSSQHWDLLLAFGRTFMLSLLYSLTLLNYLQGQKLSGESEQAANIMFALSALCLLCDRSMRRHRHICTRVCAELFWLFLCLLPLSQEDDGLRKRKVTSVAASHSSTMVTTPLRDEGLSTRVLALCVLFFVIGVIIGKLAL